MSYAFGYNSFLGFGIESQWGTGVASTKYLEITDETLKLDQKRNWKPTLGSVSQSKSTRGKRKISGGFKLPAVYQGMDSLLKQILGACSSAQIDTSTVYRHSFTLATAMPVGISIAVNRDAASIGGTSCFRYTGCQLSKMTLSQSVENFLEASFDVEGCDEVLIAKPTPTFPTFHGIDWEQVSEFTIGGDAFPFQMVELTIENPLNTDRFKLGSRLRTGLQRSGQRKVTGKGELEFENLDMYNFYRSLDSAGDLSIVWTGPEAANGEFYKLEITAPQLFVQGDTPNVKDHGIIKLPVSFELTADGESEGAEFAMVLQNLATSVA